MNFLQRGVPSCLLFNAFKTIRDAFFIARSRSPLNDLQSNYLAASVRPGL